MGKGNRNDRQRIENQSANEEKFLQKKKAQQSKTRSDKAIAAACIVIALIVVAILVINVFNETGVFMRIQPVMESNEVVVDKAMMTFFVNDYISNWYNEYISYVNENMIYFLYGYMNYISLDMSKDLSAQKITDSDVNSYLGDSGYVGRTWYDYFHDQIISTVEMYVAYANAANNEGITLTDADRKEIDETIDTLKSSLRKQGVSISDVYGKGVSESDIRKCYELIYLASAFGEKNKADIEASLRGDGYPKVEEFRDKHKEDYYFAKVLSYSISLSENKFKTEEEYDSAVEAAKAAIETIAKAKNPEQFLQFVGEYLENPVETGSPKETTSETKTETETKKEPATDKDTNTETKEETETADPLDKYTNTIYYETDDELGKWLFDETDPAWDNEVKVLEETGSETETETKKPSTTESETKKPSKAADTESDSETETGSSSSSSAKVYKTFKVTVYMVRNHRGLDMTFAQSFGYMVTTDKAAAESFLKTFNALKDEEKTRDKFYDIADAYYEKHYANHVHTDDEKHEDPVYSYDKVDNAKEKYFNDTYSKVNKWLDDDARVEGEYTNEYIEVTTGSGDSKVTYYFVVYFEKHGTHSWYYDVFADLTQELINEWYDAELKANPVDVNENAFGDITVVKYSSGS